MTNQLSDEFLPRKQSKTKWHKNCFPKLHIKPILGNLLFTCLLIAAYLQLANCCLKSIIFSKLGVFWNPQDFLFKMGPEIFQFDAAWAEEN